MKRRQKLSQPVQKKRTRVRSFVVWRRYFEKISCGWCTNFGAFIGTFVVGGLHQNIFGLERMHDIIIIMRNKWWKKKFAKILLLRRRKLVESLLGLWGIETRWRRKQSELDGSIGDRGVWYFCAPKGYRNWEFDLSQETSQRPSNLVQIINNWTWAFQQKLLGNH